jgi:hypothetical protein
MVERIDEMPTGTVGLRASGKLSREDYLEVLEPALSVAIESGEIRLVFLLTDFDGLEPGAWIEDAKTGLGAWVRHHSTWKRFALVTDVEWVAKATRVFAWLAPGEVKIYGPGQLEEAKGWVGG